MTKVTGRAKKISLVILIIIMLPIAALFWRNFILPLYTQLTFGTAVSSRFNSNFQPITDRLQDLGLQFTEHANGDCGNAAYKGLHESMRCDKNQRSDFMKMSSQSLKDWQSNSADFEKYLLANGWRRTHNGTNPYDDGSFNDLTVGKNQISDVEYSKLDGKTECIFSIRYESDSMLLLANEDCSRNIDFFGGYHY